MGNRWWDKGYTWQGLAGGAVGFVLLPVAYVVMAWLASNEVSWILIAGWLVLAAWFGWRAWRLFKFTKEKEASRSTASEDGA